MANFMPFLSMGWFTSGCTTSVLIQQGSWDVVIHRQWQCIAPSSVVLSSLQSRYQQAQCLVRTVSWTLCLSTADRIKGKTPSTAYMRSPLYYDLIAARGPTSSYDHIGNWVFFSLCVYVCVRCGKRVHSTHACGGQMITLWSWFSPSTFTCGLRVELSHHRSVSLIPQFSFST